MSRTGNQRQASRENGAKSRGPATPEGKERSARNATRHGLFSDSILLEPENRGEWNRMAEDLVARFHPADSVELSIIHDMAVTQWRKQRAWNIEAAILEAECESLGEIENEPGIRRIARAWSAATGKQKALEDLGKQSLRLGNYWMRLHRKLKELQADRKSAERAAPTPASEIRETNPAGARKGSPDKFNDMTQAALRVVSRYPGLHEKVADVLILQPGQSRRDHFKTLIRALLKQTGEYRGLGHALAEAIAPFAGVELW